MENLSSHFPVALLVCALAAAALWDWKYRKIPNLITFPLAIASLGYHGATRGMPGLLFSLGGLALGIAVLILFYLQGGMGAGDVKLMGAVGSALGPLGVLNAFLLAALAGGLYAVILLAAFRRQRPLLISRSWYRVRALLANGMLAAGPAEKDTDMPRLCYGIAIAVGTLGALGWMATQGRFPVDLSLLR